MEGSLKMSFQVIIDRLNEEEKARARNIYERYAVGDKVSVDELRLLLRFEKSQLSNTTSVNDLNSKVDILIKNTSFDETFKNYLLSLVQNKVVGNVDIYMNKTVTISYNWTVTGGPGLSTGINLPTATVYDLDLRVSNNYSYIIDETYTNEYRDEHGDKGYYSFSGWSY